MDLLVRATLAVRALVRTVAPFVAACAIAAQLLSGPFDGKLASSAAAVLWLALFSPRLTSRLRGKTGRHQDGSVRASLELYGLLAIALVFALEQWGGGALGPYSPSLILFIAIVAGTERPPSSLLVTVFTAALVAYSGWTKSGVAASLVSTRMLAFLLGTAAVNIGLVRAEAERTRQKARKQVQGALDRIREDARSFRLLTPDDKTATDSEQVGRLERASVEEIHQAVHYALDLLRRSQGLHSAALLWLNDASTHLRISELVTSSSSIYDGPIPAGDGVLGAVLARRERISLGNLRPSYNIPYYAGDCPIRSFLAIPILEGETLRGVLAVDRTVSEQFSPHEEEVVAQAARFCLRAVQNERVFVQLERAKAEQGRLYRAAEALSAELTESGILEAAVTAVREIASFDLAAVTAFDPSTGRHRVSAAKSAGEEIEKLVGEEFAHNAGLVSMVVQNRCALPYRGEHDAGHQVVLSRKLPWPKLPSLLVLPLTLGDNVLGTLVLGAKRRGAFGDQVRPTLEVLARHLAVSLSNARMVHKLETMATTDGLTGLLNKRAMQDAATQRIEAAARFGRKLSVLITDIDFFKRVNDTYGHDVGDVVIKGLGDVLTRQKRGTDIVARFGGEEFVVVCEQTDEAGAMLLANRIREELMKTVFRTANGNLSVTCSLGVATFPEAGMSWESLFKAADEALYVSKRTGRNKCTAFQPPAHKPALKAVGASRK